MFAGVLEVFPSSSLYSKSVNKSAYKRTNTYGETRTVFTQKKDFVVYECKRTTSHADLPLCPHHDCGCMQ